MIFHINSEHGHISFSPFTLTWGNALEDLELPGFFSVGIGQIFLEMGDVDQGAPGIYLTRFVEGEPRPLLTIWKA